MEKLTITNTVDKSSFRALINPSKYSESFGVAFTNNNTNTTIKEEPKVAGAEPQTYTLDFVLDSTGIVSNDTGVDTSTFKNNPDKSVKSQLDHFKKVAGIENNQITAPVLKIEWGELFLPRVKLTQLKVDFTLYDPNGIALRAKLTTTFTESPDPDEKAATQNATAASNTTVTAAPASGSLPSMAALAYGSAALFATVAATNNLNSVMSVSAGTSLTFPSL